MKTPEKYELGKKLQEIRSKIGRIVVCQVGVKDNGEFDILNIETAVPFEDNIQTVGEKKKPRRISEERRPVFYIN